MRVRIDDIVERLREYGASDDDVARRLGVPTAQYMAWAHQGYAPWRKRRRLKWILGAEETNAQLADPAVPRCAWMEESVEEKSLQRIVAHQKRCEVCQARKEYLKVHEVGPSDPWVRFVWNLSNLFTSVVTRGSFCRKRNPRSLTRFDEPRRPDGRAHAVGEKRDKEAAR